MSSTNKMHPNMVQLKFRQLVNYVAQGFYTDDYVTVLDVIASVDYITFDKRDDMHYYKNVLNGRLRTRSDRWIQALVKKLHLQYMVLKDTFGGQDYYYISFEFFINVLKYRISLLEEAMRKEQKSPSDLKSKFICSNRCCDENNDVIVFTTDSIASIGSLICPECTKKGRRGKIQQCEFTKTNTRQFGLVNKLRNQLQPIMELLNVLSDQSWSKMSPAEMKMHEAEVEAEEKERQRGQYGFSSADPDGKYGDGDNVDGREKGNVDSKQAMIFRKIGTDGHSLNFKIEDADETWDWNNPDSNNVKRRKLDNDATGSRSEMPDFAKTSSITGRSMVRNTTGDNALAKETESPDASLATVSHNEVTNVSLEEAEKYFNQRTAASNQTSTASAEWKEASVEVDTKPIDEEIDDEDDESDDDF